jgi:hypothetical protein
MSLSPKLRITLTLHFALVVSLLFFAPCQKARSSGLSDFTQSLGDNLGNALPGRAGSANRSRI